MARKKFDKGGKFEGASHKDGGIPLTVSDTKQKVEVEGNEVAISGAAFQDNNEYTYTGTNIQILDKLNRKYGGKSMSQKAESVSSGDFIICKVSVADKTVRTITGTPEQIVSAINATGGCKNPNHGAEVEVLKKKYKNGGQIILNTQKDPLKLFKVKSFHTEEGDFDIYDVEKEGARNRVDMFTVFKDKNGWIIRNAFVPDALQKKGIATDFYKRMNEQSLKATKKPLRSTQERTLKNGEKVHELSSDGIKLWDSLVKKGVAEKLGEKKYRFLNKKYKNGGEILKGGKADGMSLQSIADHHKVPLREVYNQWDKGWKHEQEHTSNLAVASEIAKDHIYERLDYYDMLDKAENKFASGGYISTKEKEANFESLYGVKYIVIASYLKELVEKQKQNQNAALEVALATKGIDEKRDEAFLDFLEIWFEQELPSKIPPKKGKWNVFVLDDKKGRDINIRPKYVKIKTSSIISFHDCIEIISDLCSNDELRPNLNGVYIDIDNPKECTLVATDGNVMGLISFPRKAFKGDKSTLMNPKDGSTIDAKFPAYKSVLDSTKDNTIKVKVSLKDLLMSSLQVERANKFIDNSIGILVSLRIEGVEYLFYPDVFNAALMMFYKLGDAKIVINVSGNNQKAVTISNLKDPSSTTLVMPFLVKDTTFWKTRLYDDGVPIEGEDKKEENQEPEPKPKPIPQTSEEPKPSIEQKPTPVLASTIVPTQRMNTSVRSSEYQLATPTGEPSTLSYLQQVLVRSDAFKKFFGDWESAAFSYLTEPVQNTESFHLHYRNVSKVLNYETLEPRVMFHGTKTADEFFEFDVYRKKTGGRPYGYFAENREYSENFSQTSQTGAGENSLLYETFLNIRNPFFAIGERFELKRENADYWLDAIKERRRYDENGSTQEDSMLDRVVDSLIKEYVEAVYKGSTGQFWLLMAADRDKRFKTFLVNQDYDGVAYHEEISTVFDPENPAQYTKAYVILDATQVKLADGRNFNFDSSKNDIRMEQGGKILDSETGFEVEQNRDLLPEKQEPVSEYRSYVDQMINKIHS